MIPEEEERIVTKHTTTAELADDRDYDTNKGWMRRRREGRGGGGEVFAESDQPDEDEQAELLADFVSQLVAVSQIGVRVWRSGLECCLLEGWG